MLQGLSGPISAGNDKEVYSTIFDQRDTQYGQKSQSWGAENGDETVMKLLLEKGAEK